MNKKCTQCNSIKPIDNFHKDNKAKDGKRFKCKECVNENRRKRFELYPEHERAINKLSREKPENRIKHYERIKQWRIQNHESYTEYNRERIKHANPHIMELNRQIRRSKAIALLSFRKALKESARKEIYSPIIDKYSIIQSQPDIEWRDIIGYEGLYRISNHGDVFSLISGKILNLVVGTYGYYHVNLYLDGIATTTKVHILVGKHFISNPHGKPFINHKDLNKKNNMSSNLEYVTQLENAQHYHAMKYAMAPLTHK